MSRIVESIDRTFAVFAEAAGIWLISWGIRRRGQFDYQLDRFTQAIRWTIVTLSFFAVGQLPGGDVLVPRLICLFLGLIFLCWPNSAYHFVRLFGHRLAKNTEKIDSNDIY